jgi:Sulfotransferase domain
VLRRAARAALRALGWRPPARHVRVRPDDLFLVSYPKSGNTWFRFLLAHLRGHEATFANIEELVPDIYRSTGREMQRLASPRILKSHEPFDPRYPRAIYVVRDPRDVAVSYFHYLRKQRQLDDETTLDELVELFVSGQLDRYGTWGENVASWLTAERALRIRYEDALHDTPATLREIARFAGWEVSEEAIERAIAASAADRMRESEHEWTALEGSRDDIAFVREARSGGWRDVLSDDAVALIEHAFAPQMQALCYELRNTTTK